MNWLAMGELHCNVTATALALSYPSYLAHVRAVEEAHMGSGYVAGYGCRRALQEAFSGLFFSTHEEIERT